MNPILLQAIVFVGCFLSGALAGIDIDGFFVRFPAWRHLGPAAWAAYSRKADLGNGLFLYPLLAVGHALLTITVAISLLYHGPAGALYAAYFAAGFASVGLLLTIRAAPIMLSLKHSGDDRQVLEKAFRGFAHWSLLRAIAQVLAFIATLWLLVRLSA